MPDDIEEIKELLCEARVSLKHNIEEEAIFREVLEDTGDEDSVMELTCQLSDIENSIEDLNEEITEYENILTTKQDCVIITQR